MRRLKSCDGKCSVRRVQSEAGALERGEALRGLGRASKLVRTRVHVIEPSLSWPGLHQMLFLDSVVSNELRRVERVDAVDFFLHVASFQV